MKDWLSVVVDRLAESPVLALSTVHNLALAAVFDRQGNLLGGGLGSAALSSLAAGEARMMSPGECRVLPQPAGLTLECLAHDLKSEMFWSTARNNQDGAWASWLLTMPRLEGGGLKMTRHLLSAFGPQTTPRLPDEFRGQWSILPLKAGLGRLFVFGDDFLALETAAQAARVGLTVTLISAADFDGTELNEARQLGEFDLTAVNDWPDISADFLTKAGIIDGVRVVVTTGPGRHIQKVLDGLKPAYMALTEEEGGSAAHGLFSKPATTAQKALGLVAEMLN